jgi:thiol-disulfide isomerase/thioredoxin
MSRSSNDVSDPSAAPAASPAAAAGAAAVLSPVAGGEPGFAARVGLALLEPRWALAIAGDRRNPGRSGSDLMRVIGLLLLGGHLRGVVVAAWLAAGVDAALGLRTGAAVMSAALTTPLAFLVIAALVLWLAAGPARQLGRAFDLASVAAVPLLLVLMVGAGAMHLLELPRMPGVSLAFLGLGFGWAGAVVALGLATARTRASVAAVAPAAVVGRGRRAGRVALGVAALLTALQLGWIATNLDELRPVVPADPAPAFALPEIGRGGALGPRYAVAPGQVTGAVPGVAATARPIVLDFWATWCGVCLRGLPQLEAFRKAHPEIDFVSINLDDAVLARQIFDDRGYGMRLLFDDGLTSRRYNVSALPHLVVIDRDGRVHRVVRGHPGSLEALMPPHDHAER